MCLLEGASKDSGKGFIRLGLDFVIPKITEAKTHAARILAQPVAAMGVWG
jgi:hypothetical protein